MVMTEEMIACSPPPKEEVIRRIEGLREDLKEKGISFAIILQNVDLFYFTGTMPRGVLVVPASDASVEPIFFVEKGVEKARKETPLEVIPKAGLTFVRDVLAKKGLMKGVCGMELDVLPYNIYARWNELLKIEIKDISPIIKGMRMIKSKYEIGEMKRSGRIISHVFNMAKEIIDEGMRELDIASTLESEGRRFGHQGFLRMRGFNQEMDNICVTHGLASTIPSFTDAPIQGTGITPAFPHGPSFGRLKRGIPILIDYGGGYNGYTTDETRTYVIGMLEEPFKRSAAVAIETIEETMDFAREGVNGREIFLRALKKVKKEGLEEYFMGYGEGKVSFIGHGLGLEINELPVITGRHDIILREGMVFAFEPKFVIPEKGAIGIEVDFIVRKDRLERVTNTSFGVIYL